MSGKNGLLDETGFFGGAGSESAGIDTDIQTRVVPQMGELDGVGFDEEDAPAAAAEQPKVETPAVDNEDDSSSEESPTEQAAEAEEPADQADQSGQASEIEVEAGRRRHKFKLDSNDPELRRTLRAGIKAPKLRTQLEESSKRIGELDSTIQSLRPKAELVDDIQEALSQKAYDRVIRAVLGDHYKEWKASSSAEAEEYAYASAARRAEIDRDRETRERAIDEHYARKEREKMAADHAALKEQMAQDRIESMLVPIWQRYHFNDVIEDKAAASAKHQRLWTLTVGELQSMGFNDLSQVSPEVLNKVMRQEYRTLTAGLKSSGKAAVKAAEKKAVEVKNKATVAATQQYAGRASSIEDKTKAFDGKDFNTLFDIFR